MEKINIAPAPHIKAPLNSTWMMRDVLIALLPATGCAIYFFGLPALIIIFWGITSALFFEFLMLKIKKTASSADYYSAAITGLLLALIVSPATTWWAIVIGCAISILIAKHAFGGLGSNIFNPALVGRAFLVASWPLMLTTWVRPFDAVATATPLHAHSLPISYWAMFLGHHAGSIGETSVLALLLGAAYLFWRQTIEWRIPSAYLATVFIFSILFKLDPWFQLMAGGLVLGTFFIATDPVTTPVTKTGRILFGIGAGIITMVIRRGGGYPEGVCYAILIMNAVAPLLDRYFPGRIFGHKR